jgi:hypothetical protein
VKGWHDARLSSACPDRLNQAVAASGRLIDIAFAIETALAFPQD